MDKCRFKDMETEQGEKKERTNDGQMVEEEKKGKRKILNILIKD